MTSKLPELINKPLIIGSKKIENRLILAPMTYLGHVAFRELLDESGSRNLMFSEMCSAGRLPHENRRTSGYFKWRDQETRRLIIQIVGSDPDRMALAAQRIETEGFFGVDINLGCSAKGICRHQQGAALLKSPQIAVEIVRKVRRAVQCPVTVKFRTGWQDDSQFPVSLAVRLQDAGADALTFHPRVAPDRRARHPKWEYIGLVKQAVRIPVFGNGNVFDEHDCLKMMESTDCDGVALGRIAIARPWVFTQWGSDDPSPDDLHRRTAMRLLTLTEKHFDPLKGLRRYKRYASYLAANFAFGNSLFNKIRIAADYEQIEAILTAFFDTNPAVLKRPNMHFMR
ncbi:MAG: tRNA-dihydrouridine synthase family protein [Desulfobacteraceae bacterium]|nr:tRNA-dihydrouridine synthase family protein [Desulfobacteraceae bacterium]